MNGMLGQNLIAPSFSLQEVGGLGARLGEVGFQAQVLEEHVLRVGELTEETVNALFNIPLSFVVHRRLLLEVVVLIRVWVDSQLQLVHLLDVVRVFQVWQASAIFESPSQSVFHVVRNPRIDWADTMGNGSDTIVVIVSQVLSRMNQAEQRQVCQFSHLLKTILVE